MPKDTNILPNERIDIPDFKNATSGIGRALQKQAYEQLWLDNAPAVSDGFRVEIADQTASPGLFTLFNGVALDRDGQIVNNEDAYNTSRSQTLLADATYYLEARFVEGSSDVDARPFWDPTFNNGTDPSGDVRATGREFSQNVSTRLSPDWEIVTPISTTGFDFTTDPDSIRIPVATIEVVGGLIVNGTTAPLQSPMAAAISAPGATSVQLLDTRAMQSSFTLQLDPGGANQEDLTVLNNDRANGILSFSAGTANAHAVGTRAEVAGGTPEQFLTELGTTAHAVTNSSDARIRFYRGDEERGKILNLDPSVVGDVRNDASVQSLKRYVDFLAGQLRELKFGAQTSAQLGQLAPPTSFTSEPRYFENAGGLLGARTNSLSIGDGTTSWGDFNSSAFANDQAMFQAAVDAITTGGVIYIKKGTYSIAGTTVTVAGKNISFVGDGPGATIIQFTSTASVFTCSGGIVNFENLEVRRNGASALDGIAAEGELTARNCVIDGLGTTGGGITRGHFVNCVFDDTNDAIEGAFSNTTFDNCSFNTQSSTTAACADLNGTASNIVFRNCQFSHTAGQTPNYLIDIEAGYSDLTVERCTFSGNANGVEAVRIGGGGASRLAFRDCESSLNGGFITAFQAENLSVENCEATFGIGQVGVWLQSSCKWVKVRDCRFTCTGLGTTSCGVRITSAGSFLIDGNTIDCDEGIELILAVAAQGDNTISNNNIIHATADTGVVGIRVWDTNNNKLNIINNNISEIRDNVATDLHGIYFPLASLNLDNVHIKGNKIHGVGVTGVTTDAYGIFMESSTAHIFWVIRDNTIFDIQGSANVAGIQIENSLDQVDISNNTIRTIATGEAATAFWGIYTKRCAELTVIGNRINDIGHILSTTSAGGGIRCGDSASSLEEFNATISNNTITDIQRAAGAGVFGIYVFGITSCAVVGNALNLSHSEMVGILVQDGSGAGGQAIKAITINNNTVYGDYNNGIDCFINDNQENWAGTIAINGNAIEGFQLYGIQVDGVGVDFFSGRVSVVGNSCHSDGGSGAGIRFTNVVRFTITGNNIVMSQTTGSSKGIALSNCNFGTVCGNAIDLFSTTSTAACIDADLNTSGYMMIAGNFCSFGRSLATDCDSDGIRIGDEQFVAANFAVRFGNALGTSQAITAVGSGSWQKASPNGDLTLAQDPIALTDIGLNRRDS